MQWLGNCAVECEWRFPQGCDVCPTKFCAPSAAFAEHAGATSIPQVAEEGNIVYSECSGVIQAANLGNLFATDPKRTAAGCWLNFPHESIVLKKTKAHRDVNDISQEEQFEYDGNDWADFYAKSAGAS